MKKIWNFILKYRIYIALLFFIVFCIFIYITVKAYVDPVDESKQTIQIDFNTPFIYLVKEKNSTNLWYFGIVYEPMLWDEYAKLIEQAEKEAERKKRGW